ncbi:NAD(P)/FAD-dependent oxidoreductase [Pseudanabaena sp. ABRG5-3]|uniref:NAD(P)/FAD-dependent oxidoreductase n=1 Tax=Pseudanabaena sp. ABRG5-3 TaxID=685565 RepID=UPI000DC6F801|nr:NAD(P)/FAD-dependent oxidoreductase [Pseudanabaena sp. ABRG5-3]BBC24359.1 FAD-dependent pyridine nucleotide-disulphide oxidoreductase [Pseudanabaena sp. ABRG5-3]
MTRICILGGGFGGLYTALNLSRLPWAVMPEIILIDKSDRFLFTPFLYELITAEMQEWEIAPTFTELFADTGIQFMQGTVTNINFEAQQVEVNIGQRSLVEYDHLVLAIGGETPMHFVAGASEYAIPFRNLNDFYRLNSKLELLEASNRDKIRVCIAGGGSSGVELACKIADRLKERGRVRLVDRNDKILVNSTDANRAIAELALSQRGVWTDLNTRVSQVTEDEVTLDYADGSDTLPVDIVLWTVGSTFSKVIQNLPIAHNRLGAIATEPTLQVQGYPHVFAIGDLAGLETNGQTLPATAQVAFQQSQYCAWNIWASINQKSLVNFSYIPLGEFISLGIDGATASILGKFSIDGLPAHAMRRLAYLLRMPTLQHQWKIGTHWLTKPLIEIFRKSV